MQNLQARSEENLRNSEAESSWVRRNLWGETAGTETSTSGEADDEMGHTILGDITTPAPIVMQTPQSNNAPMIAAVLAALAAGGLGGYLLSEESDPEPQTVIEQRLPDYEDQSLSIGLGRIEDYERTGETD